MKQYKKQIELVTSIMREYAMLSSLQQQLEWDQWVNMAQEGAPYRAQLFAYQTVLAERLFSTQQAQALAAYFQAVALEEIECIYEKGTVRKFLWLYKQHTAIPQALSQEFSFLSSCAQREWMVAVEKADYLILKPSLEKLFSLRMAMAKHLNADGDIHETLMNVNDEGISKSEYEEAAGKVKVAANALLQKIRTSTVTIEDRFLQAGFDQDALFDFAKYMANAAGYTHTRGGFALAPHPFSSLIGPKEARITTNCSSYGFGVLAAIHEAGHALYACGGDENTDASGLWGGIPGGFHEGQSRLLENMLGRNKAFWCCHYQEAQKRFPQFQEIPLDLYYKALNKINFHVRRTLADEVSYCLHPIIRFELEGDLFAKKLSFDDLPDAWGAKYQEYLGICPQNDAEGVLQDVHWAAGAIGYFQSYTLGNMYSAQIMHAITLAEPDLDAQLSAGNTASFHRWLDENIRRYGNVFTADEMIERACGEKLNADYYIDYLNGKYQALYELE